MKHLIKTYPVGNGDMSLLKLTDNTTILIDSRIRAAGDDPDDDTVFDVKNDLLESIERRNSNPFLHVYILTHADKDHCHGFEKHFYTGNPSNYSKADRDGGFILIDELWVSPALFENGVCADAECVRKEARRRIKLQQDNHADKDLPGNRIVLIGYDEQGKFQNVTNHVPGTTVTKFNGSRKDNFELFIHAPFKADLVTCRANEERNPASIAFQARFKMHSRDSDFACRALFLGDIDHYIAEKILEKSQEHGNEHALEYDLLVAPHHCSWSFFNDVPYTDMEEHQTPKDYVLELLGYKRTGAYIIASSKPILDDDKNPPHYPARTEYVKVLGGSSRFLNTETYPDEATPEPIEFHIEHAGITLVDKVAAFRSQAAVVLSSISRRADKPYCAR